MKKILLAVLMLAMLLCGTALAESEVLRAAADNATFLITEINSMGSGFTSDGVLEDAATNTIAVCFEAEDYSFADFCEVKKNDPARYQELLKEFLFLSDEINAACDVDLLESVHVVFAVMSNDGVGLFLTFDQLDLTWLICAY